MQYNLDGTESDSSSTAIIIAVIIAVTFLGAAYLLRDCNVKAAPALPTTATPTVPATAVAADKANRGLGFSM